MKIKYTLTADASVPVRHTDGAAGYDIALPERIRVLPGVVTRVPTGISLQLPQGIEAQVRARSSLTKLGLMVHNSPGTIDWDYRGVISIVLYNPTNHTISLDKGQRVAQLVFNKVELPVLERADKLDETQRGVEGFGSTGENSPTGEQFVQRDSGFIKADGKKFKISELLSKMEANGLSLDSIVSAVELADEAGKSKYGPKNWLKSDSAAPFLDAAFRHYQRWLLGEEIDESGYHHFDHILINALFALGIKNANNS